MGKPFVEKIDRLLTVSRDVERIRDAPLLQGTPDHFNIGRAVLHQ